MIIYLFELCVDENLARKSENRILKYVGRPQNDTHKSSREKENIDQTMVSCTPKQSKNVREKILEGLTVRIYTCDINAHPADCLVVPYKQKQFALSHGILIAAGNSVKEELNKSMNAFGTFRPSDCRVTGSGRLKHYKRIIHMSLNENKNDFKLDLLTQALINSLKKAKDLSYSIVAILLTGMAEAFHRTHAEQYFDAIKLFTREHGQSTIQEVHLIHPNDEYPDTAMDTFRQMSVKADIEVHGRDFVFGTANNLRPYSAGYSLMGTNMSFTIGPKTVRVNVAIGGMTGVSVDGIVCIQDVDFSSSSQTAKDILRLCGQSYREEFNEVRIHSRVIGTVLPIRIRNGAITCQYVINVILPNCISVDFDKSATTLKEMTSNILRESEQLKLTSLAMPYLESIDDSKLDWHVSNKSSSEAMVSSILAFFNNDESKEKTFLRRLDILVNEKEILRELNLTFKRLCDQ